MHNIEISYNLSYGISISQKNYILSIYHIRVLAKICCSFILIFHDDISRFNRELKINYAAFLHSILDIPCRNASLQCLHGGQCIPDEDNIAGFRCKCLHQFSGRFCEFGNAIATSMYC